MAEQQKTQSWWQTLPGTLTAIGGVITAATALIGVLIQSGVFEHKTESQQHSTPPPTASTSVATSRKTSKTNEPSSTSDRSTNRAGSTSRVSTASTVPEQTTDGWAIIGKTRQGRFFELTLMVGSGAPAIGRRYQATQDFRVVQKRPEGGVNQGQVITLGRVHTGDTVEILDLYIPVPSTETVFVWAKLRAVLHDIPR